MLTPQAVAHLQKLWTLSRELYTEGRHALSAFFAITLIEEVGKIVILANSDLGVDLDKKAWTDHRAKYRYAVGATLLVNSRVSRIYGPDESRFAAWFRQNELFNIRNRALYLELVDDQLIAPEESVARRDAFLLVCIGGEVLAEIQGTNAGTGPDQWRQILAEIDSFRAKADGEATVEKLSN